MNVGDTIYCEDGHKHIITKVEEHDLWSIRSGTKIMIIKGFYPSGSAECHHPTMGIGAFSPLELKKIGGTMSKYEELKDRISKVEGWTKEADDILQEIGVEYNIDVYAKKDNKSIVPYIWNSLTPFNIFSERFSYTDPCSKNEAFKKALMWLLDNSDIKKEEVREMTVEEVSELAGCKVKIVEG